MRIESHEWPVLVVAAMLGVAWTLASYWVVTMEILGLLRNDPLSWVKALLCLPAVAGVFAAAWLDQHGVVPDLFSIVSVSALITCVLAGIGALALLRRLGA